MGCETRMSSIEPPTTYIYAVFFILGCFVTIVGNAFSLLVLSLQRHKTRYIRLLMCLSSADFLVGLIVFPLNSYQLVTVSGLNDCGVDLIRSFVSAFLYGSSVITLAVLTFDKCILITKNLLYKKTCTKNTIKALVVLGWIFPLGIAFVRWINATLYLSLVLFIFIGPFIVLTVCYVFITKTVRRQENLLKIQYGRPSSDDVFCDASQVKRAAASSYNNVNKGKRKKKELKLARIVIILILVYFCCVLPLMIWLVLNLVNNAYTIWEANIHQHLYLFSILGASYNSCLNPFIYFGKHSKFRKQLRRLFRLTIVPTVVANTTKTTANLHVVSEN